MKLYHLNPNNWGVEYYVMSDSPENAFKAIREHQRKDMENEAEKCKDSDFKLAYYKDVYEAWDSVTFDKLPTGYTLDEYDVNEVIETEIA
jgi:hypothetical protein